MARGAFLGEGDPEGAEERMGVAAIRDEVLDLVYETTVDAGLWPKLLRRFSEMLGAHDAAFRAYDVFTETGVVMTGRLDAEALDENFRRFADRNPLKSQLGDIVRGVPRWKPGLKRDIEWLPKSEFVRTAYYREFYQAFDIHSDLSIGLSGANHRWAGIDIYRSERQGAFTDEDIALCESVHPHLLRAHRLSGKLAQAQGLSAGLADVFDRSPHGLFLLDREGRVQHVNAAGHRLIAAADGVRLSGGKLCGVASAANARLRALIGGAAADGSRLGGSMALSGSNRRRRLSVEVAPLPERQAWPLHAGPAVMVCITDLEAGVELQPTALRELFDLTPAEIRVAGALFEGLEPAQAAKRLGLGLATIRTHLAHIYAKTGTTGQSDLARLLSRLATA